MGNQHTKEDIVIAQTASGDAQATQKSSQGLSTSEILLITILLVLLGCIAYYLIKKYRKNNIKMLRRELNGLALKAVSNAESQAAV